MTPFAVAGLQLDLAENDSNLNRIGTRIASLVAHFPFVQMVVLSELATFGPSPAHAQPLPGPAEETYAQIAAKHKIWLVPGSLFEKTAHGVFNTASVISPEGKVVGRYR